MPTLQWIGKDKVVNHHQQVPYRVLKHVYSFDEQGKQAQEQNSGNMIIHGDNLEALKALLPMYEGRIKCIYIDPPYNTGNEKWVYNDNVNDPRIKKWLGDVVGKEGEDLSRHDKWLCMMYPRLRLLQKLLSYDGAIFISIDDNEYASLKFVCDEIFGSHCFVSNISWQRNYSTRNDSKGIVNEVEHVLVFSKTANWNPRKLPRTDAMNSKYKNPDNDSTPWRTSDAFAPGAIDHQGMVYAIQHPITGKMLYPNNGRHWPYAQEQMLKFMLDWSEYKLQNLSDDEVRANICGVSPEEVRKDIKGIVLSEPLEIASKKALAVYKRGQWPRFFFTSGGKGGIAKKTYLENVGGKLPTNLWLHSDAGHTDEAKKEMLAIFTGQTTFDTPKPTRLLEFVLQIASDDNSIVLDSFAGSGTTAHAVLNLNRQDGGNRKFILIEMMDYAENITAERVKRVIRGYENGTKTTEGTGGGFSFYELGERLRNEDETLNEAVGIDQIKAYIWFTETRTPWQPPETGAHHDYLGQLGGCGYYFHYDPDAVTALSSDYLATITQKAEQYVIYADICTLSEEELLYHSITFRKIPRDIAKV